MAKGLKPVGAVTDEGIDVSAYQGEIDFERVRAAGKTAVYIRASLGTDYTDPRMEENYENARAAGLRVGFYHYVTARNASEAAREARFFVDRLRGKAFELRPAMDFERFEGISDAEANEIARVFLETLEQESGKKAVIYTGAYRARTLWDRELAEKYPLWAADYGAALPEYNDKWPGWVGFQYDDRGRVSGISGNVDLDRFTEGIRLSDGSAVPGTPSPPVGDETKLICVTVRRGDTLTALAARYGTTVAALAKLNALADPDRIRAGQRLYVRVAATAEGECCDEYTVRRGDTLSGIARRFDTTVARLAGINRIADINLIREGQRLMLGLCGQGKNISRNSL